MNHKLFSLFVLGFIGIASAVKVPVTIYYESLCPDSAKFITEQVFPAVRGPLKDYVEITWVPFGKSEYSTQGADTNFNCHHGPNECYGNKVHACAIEHIQVSSYQIELTRESQTLAFITCMMKFGKNFPDNVYPGARCAKENSVQWEIIQQCANSTEGSDQLKKQGDITNRFQKPLLSVPTVVFQQTFDTKENERAMTDFVGAVCKHVPQPLPAVCTNRNGAASVSLAAALPICGALLYGVLSKLL